MAKKYRMFFWFFMCGIFACCPIRAATSLTEGPSSATLQSIVRHYGRLRFEPCTLGNNGAGHIQALCSQLSVPENPVLPEGRRITLKIAWLERDNGSHDVVSDPVFFIAGGSGQSAT